MVSPPARPGSHPGAAEETQTDGPADAANVSSPGAVAPPAPHDLPASPPGAFVRGWRRTMWVSAATQTVTLFGFGMVIPFMPLYVQALGVEDPAQVALWSGALYGAAALPMALVAPLWGLAADRYGRKLMLVRSMLGGAALLAGMGFVSDVWQLLVLRVLQGSVTGSVAAASAVIAAGTPTQVLGYALGILNVAMQVGNMLGPALGGELANAVGFRGTFVFAGVMLAIGGFMALFWTDEPPRQPLPRRDAPRRAEDGGHWLVRSFRPFAWPRFRTVLLLHLGVQFAFTTTLALLPLYVQGIPRPEWLFTERAAGLAVVLSAVSSAVVTPFAGRWTDRHGPRGLLLVSLACMVLALLPQGLVPSIGLLMFLRVVLGVGMAGVTTTLGVFTKVLAPRDREGVAYGAMSTAQALGWGLGPMLGSALAAVVGVPAIFVVSAVIVAALLALVWRGGP